MVFPKIIKKQSKQFFNSGNKNCYYFLNRLHSYHFNINNSYWKKHLSKLQMPFKLSSKHFKSAYRSLVSLKPHPHTIGRDILESFKRIAKDPKFFLIDSNGEKVIKFRGNNSEDVFIEKCNKEIFPLLERMMLDIDKSDDNRFNLKAKQVDKEKHIIYIPDKEKNRINDEITDLRKENDNLAAQVAMLENLLKEKEAENTDFSDISLTTRNLVNYFD